MARERMDWMASRTLLMLSMMSSALCAFSLEEPVSLEEAGSPGMDDPPWQEEPVQPVVVSSPPLVVPPSLVPVSPSPNVPLPVAPAPAAPSPATPTSEIGTRGATERVIWRKKSRAGERRMMNMGIIGDFFVLLFALLITDMKIVEEIARSIKMHGRDTLFRQYKIIHSQKVKSDAIGIRNKKD